MIELSNNKDFTMAKLSELRVTVHTTYTVNPDGTAGEIISQTEPRYSTPGVVYASAEHALSEVEDDSNDPVEGEIVDKKD